MTDELAPRPAQTELERQLAEAADYHVGQVATWFNKIPAALRLELGTYLTSIVASLDQLSRKMPADLDPTEIAPYGMQLWGLLKGYEGGKVAVAGALRRLIPELAPLADALLSP